MAYKDAEMVWIEGDYVLVKETPNAIGIGNGSKGERGGYDIQSWLPKSRTGYIRYSDGEETKDIKEGAKITGIEVEDWLVDEKQSALDVEPTPAEKVQEAKDELDSNEW